MPRLVSGVVVEVVGDDVLVVVPGTTDALSLSGEAAKTVLTIQAGQSVPSSDPVVGELVARGVVEVPGLSRRGLIRAGAVGAGAGIAAFALPSVAAASSPAPPGGEVIVLQGVGQSGVIDKEVAAFTVNSSWTNHFQLSTSVDTPSGEIGIVAITDTPPYPANQGTSDPKLAGTVTIDGEDYPAQLWEVTDGDLNTSPLQPGQKVTAWFFRADPALVPGTTYAFTLTFTFEGKNYRVEGNLVVDQPPPTVVWGNYTVFSQTPTRIQVVLENPPFPAQSDTRVVNFLTRNNLPLDTPNFPSPVPSQDPDNDISALSVQGTSGLAAFTVALNPAAGLVANAFISWDDLALPSPITFPGPDLVATFSWAGEPFEVYLLSI